MKARFINALFAHTAAALALGLAAAPATAADPFPSKSVRIVVPASAAGSLDITTRLVAQKMSEKLGQQVLVENRPGADTLLGTRAVKDAPADGYTILAQANGLTLLPHIKNDPGYDLLKDFTALGFMTRAPMIMEVGAESPDRTVTDFIARAKGGKLTYANGGVGGPPHMAAAMFLHSQGLNVLDVAYKGNGPALPDVAGGRVDMIFDGYISSIPYLQSSRLRPLAVSSPSRIAPLPNVPTFLEQGVNYTYTLWLGLVVKAGTPKEVVQTLSEALRFALSSKELSERFRNEGSDPTFLTPEVFNDYLAKEFAQMAKVASDLKLPKQ